MCLYMYVYLYVCVCIYMYVCMYVNKCRCELMNICMYVCMNICMYLQVRSHVYVTYKFMHILFVRLIPKTLSKVFPFDRIFKDTIKCVLSRADFIQVKFFCRYIRIYAYIQHLHLRIHT